MKWLYNPPKIVKSIFSRYQWESKTDQILLTFDDGPVTRNTEIILKQLQKYSIKSAFFCVGNNVEKNPGLAKEIINEGHTIGNHTFNHARLNRLSNQEMLDEIELCNRIMQDKLSYNAKYFRPPHGRIKLSLAGELKKMNLQNVMWSLLTYDYKSDLKIVRNSIKKHLKNNSIILLHDNIKSKNIIAESIDIVVEQAAIKNYKIGNPDECLK